MAQTIASLSPAYRAQLYRQLAAESLRRANSAKNDELRSGHLSMAVEWHALAMELEGSLRRYENNLEDDWLNGDSP